MLFKKTKKQLKTIENTHQYDFKRIKIKEDEKSKFNEQKPLI